MHIVERPEGQSVRRADEFDVVEVSLVHATKFDVPLELRHAHAGAAMRAARRIRCAAVAFSNVPTQGRFGCVLWKARTAAM